MTHLVEASRDRSRYTSPHGTSFETAVRQRASGRAHRAAKRAHRDAPARAGGGGAAGAGRRTRPVRAASPALSTSCAPSRNGRKPAAKVLGWAPSRGAATRKLGDSARTSDSRPTQRNQVSSRVTCPAPTLHPLQTAGRSRRKLCHGVRTSGRPSASLQPSQARASHASANRPGSARTRPNRRDRRRPTTCPSAAGGRAAAAAPWPQAGVTAGIPRTGPPLSLSLPRSRCAHAVAAGSRRLPAPPATPRVTRRRSAALPRKRAALPRCGRSRSARRPGRDPARRCDRPCDPMA